ncbi:MAG: electron transport complex subunit RsxC [Bradymonadia bacterium]|jgi:electron transport complex protein RnfC
MFCAEGVGEFEEPTLWSHDGREKMFGKGLSFKKGGVHPPGNKELTQDLCIEEMPLAAELHVILGQHIGAECDAVVARGEALAEGQLIGVVSEGLGANLHAPCAGKVKALAFAPHPTRVRTATVVIETDAEAEEVVYEAVEWEGLERDEILRRVEAAGVIGGGGAGFPTHVKLNPPADAEITCLVINGAECEPYVTADDRVMVEEAQSVLEGVGIMMRALGVGECAIGIEANKRAAIQAMREAAKSWPVSRGLLRIEELQVKYPQGSEKQLIFALTRRSVPSGALPVSVGVVVQNVSTARAVYDAVARNKPLTERVLTVSGSGVKRAANLRVKIGTRVRDIVEYLGGISPKTKKVLIGGPMMGYATPDLDFSVMKTTTALLFLTEDETDTKEWSNCIRCGWCLDACPMGLEPKEIALYVEANKGDETEQFGVLDCFECGSCAFVCPAKRPLVQFIRIAKLKAKKAARKKN